MFNSTLMDFDLDLLGAQPSNELQGYCEPYVQHMENDKKLSLTANGVEDTNIALLEDTSDLKALFDIGSLPQDDGEDVNVERIMTEVEDFLQKHEGHKEGNVEFPSTDNVDLQDLNFSKEEMDAAENLLDELLRSDVDLDPSTSAEADIIIDQPQENAVNIESQDSDPTVIKIEQNDSGFLDMSNVTQVVTEDGKNIIILIAPQSPEEAANSTHEVSNESDNDSEWTPEINSVATPKGRPMVKRSSAGTRKNKRSAPYITDKKERKKQQNVEAARRYRDKKKAEACDIETEESVLLSKNKQLKGEVAELEAELKTMKKLMTELGILKSQ